MGNRAARPLHAARIRLAGLQGCDRRAARRRFPRRAGVVRAAFRVPLPGLWDRELRRHRDRTAAGVGAVACAGRGGRAGRHRPLCGFLARTLAGEGERQSRHALPADLQWHHGAAEAHGHAWRGRGGRPLPRVVAVELSAADHPAAYAAGVRFVRQLGRPLGWRVPVSCRASRRAGSRYLPGQCAGGGDAAAGAV